MEFGKEQQIVVVKDGDQMTDEEYETFKASGEEDKTFEMITHSVGPEGLLSVTVVKRK